MSRVCIIFATKPAKDLLSNGTVRMPADVKITGIVEDPYADQYVVRLEGDGLPEWCVKPPEGGEYVQASGIVIPANSALPILIIERKS